MSQPLNLEPGAYDDMPEDTPRTPLAHLASKAPGIPLAAHLASKVRQIKVRTPETSPFAQLKHEQAALAQHSSKSWEHYTPIEYVEASRNVLGTIDLDPASCWLAQRIVKAKRWHGLQIDGTVIDGLAVNGWHGNVFLNSPGGNTCLVRPELSKISRSYPVVWWGRLNGFYLGGLVKSAIYVGFSLEQLVITQRDDMPSMFDYPFCVPRNRMRFDYPLDTRDGRPTPTTEIVKGNQPSHGNVIIYLPIRPLSLIESHTGVDRFVETFSQFGKVVVPGEHQ